MSLARKAAYEKLELLFSSDAEEIRVAGVAERIEGICRLARSSRRDFCPSGRLPAFAYMQSHGSFIEIHTTRHGSMYAPARVDKSRMRAAFETGKVCRHKLGKATYGQHLLTLYLL